MNKKIKNIAAVAFFAFAGTSSIAQVAQQKVGGNPMTINQNAALEVESTTKGLLLPRLALSATNSFAPLTAHVAGMTVYNTATNGTAPNNVTPGYYYNDGTQWVRVATGADAKTEPWFDQVTKDEATSNTENIYQMGSVAVGKDEAMVGVTLDVAGAIRAGVNPTGMTGIAGENSAAFGFGNEASGRMSFAAGEQSKATGDYSVAMGASARALGTSTIVLGADSEARGVNAVAIGTSTYAEGQNSIALGRQANATGDMSTALTNSLASGSSSFAAGTRAIASGSSSVAIGYKAEASGTNSIALGETMARYGHELTAGAYNALTSGEGFWNLTDPLFQLGNGTVFVKNNAITVLKNAHTAIGVIGTEAAAKPTELLDLGGNAVTGQGGLKIRHINSTAYTGNVATDKVVVADPNGVLKTVNPSTLVPTISANNGLTKTLNNIQLGGDLLLDTKITLDENALEFDATDSNLIISGLDKSKVQDHTVDRLLSVDANNNVKALKAAMPKFFYMPSIIVPTSEEQLNATGAGKVTGDAFNDATRQGTIQLHTRYAEQFGLTGTAQASSTGAPALPVLPADELHYYVTWYDINVFETVSVSNTGVLTYTVKSDADITIGSFMNIVFAVKED